MASRTATTAPNISGIFHKDHSKKNGSLSSRRLSESSGRLSEEALNDPTGNANRWSHSTGSSITNSNQRRHSSISKRFSFGPSAFSPSFRSNSPPKKRRPTETSTSEQSTSPSDASPILPMRRFSPLKLPNFSNPSFGVEPESNLDSTVATDTTAKSQTSDGVQGEKPSGSFSPHKRSRDGSGRSHVQLPNIAETERTSPFPANADGTRDVQSVPSSASIPHLNGSRTSSPMKRRQRPSQDALGEPVSGSLHGSHGRKRSSRDKDKKAVLQKALDTANVSVKLDNDLKYAEATAAYEEACQLLDGVMNQTTAGKERQKLRTIVGHFNKIMSIVVDLLADKIQRETYMSRIEELRRIMTEEDSEEPTEAESVRQQRGSQDGRRSPEGTLGQTSISVKNMVAPLRLRTDPVQQHGRSMPKIPRRSSSRANSRASSTQNQKQNGQGASLVSANLEVPQQSAMPRPLSPRRSPGPQDQVPQEVIQEKPNTDLSRDVRESGVIDTPQHYRNESEDTSWYNGNQEDPASRSSSPNHSISSAGGVRKRDLRNGGDTEAEFDAALDAAVEAAYNDGYEPYDGSDAQSTIKPPNSVRYSNPIAEDERNFEQREAKVQAAQHRVSLRQRNKDAFDLSAEISDEEDGIGTDEEERLLAVGDADELDANKPPESAKGRQSDSSGFSGRTWGSSAASSLNTAGTSLSTVDENASMPALPPKSSIEKFTKPQQSSPPGPPPPPPNTTKPATLSLSKVTPLGNAEDQSPASPMLRDRRLSASKAQKLKIETTLPTTNQSRDQTTGESRETDRSVPDSTKIAPGAPGSVSAFSVDTTTPSQPLTSSRLDNAPLTSPYPSPYVGSFPADAYLNTPALTSASPQSSSPRGSNKTERPPLRKPVSSMSMKKNGLLSGQSETIENSPQSPMSFGFPGTTSPMERQGTFPGSSPVTPAVGSSGGARHIMDKIFETDFHSAQEPGIPNPNYVCSPRPLEPCPESILLRPFWLMRCVHQSLANSKGSYVSRRLFIPHDAWTIKNSKLKGVEEKIANMDLLTAALLKLSSVDTLDADAVLEEMSAFESVLDQAQNNLSKKLGNEVGLAGSSNFLSYANAATMNPTSASGAGGDPAAQNNSNEHNQSGNTSSTGSRTGSKSYLNWGRKLRSKNSGTALSSSYAATKEKPSEGSYTMATLPMTSSLAPLRRPMRSGGSSGRGGRGSGGSSGGAASDSGKKANVGMWGVSVEGPNANYAGALARLCEAAQILDQIARQVEDPGLKLSSPTHVGLELSARHASEFFGFFVCRFVLQDLTMLMDKYLKRSSEWGTDQANGK